MGASTNPAAEPSNVDRDTVVDVAIAIVVDNLSDQSPPQEGSGAVIGRINRPPASLRVLISRRKAEQVLGGLWELPGGKVEPGESPADAVVRELHEEVGIEVAPLHNLPTVEHAYDHARVRLHLFICRHIAGTPSAIEVDAVRWVTPDRLADYPFPDATQPVLAALLDWLDNNPQTPAP